MGRRAKKAPVVTKKKVKLAKRFKCPFCANDDVVECKMDNKAGIGSLNCRLCGASYQMTIHHLHEPIDVFSEWLDDCEAAQNRVHTNNTNASTVTNNNGGNNNNNNNAATTVPQYDDDDDDEEDDDDDDNLPTKSGLKNINNKNQQQQSNKSKLSAAKNNRNNPSIGLGDADSDDDDDDDDDM